MNTSIQSRIQRILADICSISVEHITMETSPDMTENWDSLNHLNLVLAIEEEFGVQFEPEDIEQLLSVGHIVTLLDNKLRAARASYDSSVPLRKIRQVPSHKQVLR